jgi:hypothetical protein
LQTLRTHPGAGDIECLADYTAAATYSACAHHLRRRYPERSRLKNQLRYVLEQNARFALWTASDGGLRCGLSPWYGQEESPVAAQRLADLEQQLERWPHSWEQAKLGLSAELGQLVAEVFDQVGGPIELDGLIRFVADVWRIQSGRNRGSGGDRVERLAETGPTAEMSIDRRRLLNRLWTEVQHLPVRQRAALLLNLRDAQGAGLLWILPVTGIASMRAIAHALEMPAEEFASLWSRLPIDDITLAEQLDCTRQQVINLRMSARKRLRNRLGSPDAPEGAVRRQTG